MKTLLALLLAAALLSAGAAVHAAGQADTAAQLAQKLGVKPADITPAPIPGLYRVTLGPAVAYVSADGRYLIRGDIINLQSGDNLTVAERARARLAYLRRFEPADMIVFAPPHPKHTITVFTDIDCDYCRVLEHDRPKLNAMGIAVQYLFFPRDGVGSASWQKAVDVWCAADRKAAFEAAMNGAPPKAAKCDTAAVIAGYQFGQMLGLDGTPAILTDRGRLIDGYLPPELLVSALDLESQPAASNRH